jgi:hypothetical protein
MPNSESHLIPFMRAKLNFAGARVAVIWLLALVTPLWGQTPVSKPGKGTTRVHWHRYLSSKYGFSFWYPDSYQPIPTNDICKDNDYRQYLLCAERPDAPETSIWVTIIVAEPFHLHPIDNGGDLPPLKKVGRHEFYCGPGGSMGVGFSDECLFNLRGKTLEISFYPSQTMNSSDTTNALIFRSLKTFRVR